MTRAARAMRLAQVCGVIGASRTPHLIELAQTKAVQVTKLSRALGPGLISGASDNDPTTVASLAVIGSTTAFNLLWLLILVIPMLVVVQIISATIGIVAKAGLEDVIQARFGRVWSMITLLLVLLVNVLTLAADLEGGAAALGLLTGLSYQWFVIPFAVITALLLVWGSYQSIERVLRYVLLIFFTYVVAAIVAHPHWDQVLRGTFVPHLQWDQTTVSDMVALLGTTLTSYAYVWESIEVAHQRAPLRRLGLVQADAGLGMVVAGAIFFFIVVATGATLGQHHQQVQTAQQAALALAPVAGRLASVIFGAGLLASAILAVPVLAGTSAYVLSEAFGWRGDLDATFAQAPAFYASLLLSLLAAVGITLVGVGPIRLLFWSSIVAGLATPVTLAFLMLAARNKRSMGSRRIGPLLAGAGWVVTAVVTAACMLFLWQTLL